MDDSRSRRYDADLMPDIIIQENLRLCGLI
jgi:hypothetical protein